jgi:hypothetical protein
VRGHRIAAIGALASSLAFALGAAAQDVPPQSDAAPEVEPATPDKPGDGSGTPDRLDFGGRVFVRDTLRGTDVGDTAWREDRTLDSGRVFLDYRPNKKLRMMLEVDFAGDQAELKDTYLRFRPIKAFGVMVGRFKRPVSFIGLESAWSLPRIDRGLLSELRVEDARRLPFAGGRGDGVAVEVELDAPTKPTFTLAALESDAADDFSLDVTENLREDIYGRVQLEAAPGLHLAVAGGWVGAPVVASSPLDSYQHRAFGTVEGFYDGAWLRAWAEAMIGRNTVVYDGGELRGAFRAARALIASRSDRVVGFRAIEPFAAFAWYEPTSRQPDDQVTEVTGGVALWIARHLRLQLEAARVFTQGDRAPTREATVVRVQLGAAFKSRTELQ